MKRILIACAAIALGASVVPAASPEVDAAIKTIQSVGSDAAKMQIFCDLYNAQGTAGEKDDPKVEEQVDDMLSRLGEEFETAWGLGPKLDENSDDGKEFFAAVDGLAEKCE